jgi:hypothetical protein
MLRFLNQRSMRQAGRIDSPRTLIVDAHSVLARRPIDNPQLG